MMMLCLLKDNNCENTLQISWKQSPEEVDGDLYKDTTAKYECLHKIR